MCPVVHLNPFFSGGSRHLTPLEAKLGKNGAPGRAKPGVKHLSLRAPCVQEKLDAWDPSKADDVQYLMNMAKKYVILDTLVANGGKCTYEVLFARADEVCTHQGP